MACRLWVVAVGLLSTGTASFAPITWANAPGSDLTLLPQSFTGSPSKWSNDIPQKLAVGVAIDNRMALFSAKPDNTISVDGWCIEAVGAKSGDAVNVNICNGGANQQWNWIPEGHGRNKIQLKDTNLCLDVDHKEGRLNGAAVQLQQCKDTSSESWLYEAPEFGSGVQHVMMVLMSLAGVGAFSLGAWFWQRRSKAPIVACAMPSTADQESGLAMISGIGGSDIGGRSPFSRSGVAHMSMGDVTDDDLAKGRATGHGDPITAAMTTSLVGFGIDAQPAFANAGQLGNLSLLGAGQFGQVHTMKASMTVISDVSKDPAATAKAQAKFWTSHRLAAARCPPTVAMLDDQNEPCVEEECPSDADEPTYSQLPSLSEEIRKYRRTVYMHDEWVKHRSPDRFIKNLRTTLESGVVRSLFAEVAVATASAAFILPVNLLLTGYTDLEGVKHAAPLFLPLIPNGLTLPALPFTITMPALSLLLVFRTNTAYFRWNEARTLWGSLINTTRTVVRQANMYFPDGPEGDAHRNVLAAQTIMFAKSLRCFLRGPDDEPVLLAELRELVGEKQAEACLRASNKPMFSAGAMSTTVRSARSKLGLNPIDSARIDQSIAQLVDICGANERIFKSPIPLVYTRHTARFLSAWLFLLPLALYEPFGSSWNHWAIIPAELLTAVFFFGIEELGISIEEPFGILPLEALCNGAIEATIKEELRNHENGDYYITGDTGDYDRLPQEKIL